jgi:hypothetical protein
VPSAIATLKTFAYKFWLNTGLRQDNPTILR